MFEKEADEYAIGLTYPRFQDSQIANCVLRDVRGAFQKGAEFGYNKANEWHYVKDKLPTKNGNYLVVIKQYGKESYEIGTFWKRENVFTGGHLVTLEVIKWKEIE